MIDKMIKCPYCDKKFHKDIDEQITLFKEFNKKYREIAEIDYRNHSFPYFFVYGEVIDEVNYNDYYKAEDFVKICEEFAIKSKKELEESDK